MSIENTLERIADSLERLVDLQAGRNLLLESAALARAAAAEEAETAAAEVAEAAVEKAATRGRGRPRKNAEEPKAEAVAAPVPTEEVKTKEAVVAAQPEPVPAAPAPAANAPTVEQLQLRAPKLAQKFGKEAVTGLIKKINPAAGNISGMDDAQRVAFWAALDALEAGATTDAEFG
jgi:hypothetical protein